MAAKGSGSNVLPANAKHDTMEEYEETLEFVADLMTRGFTLAGMKERLLRDRQVRVSLVMVHKYTETIRERWRSPVMQVREDFIALKSKQLELLYREAMEAFELSKGEEQVRTVERVVPLRLKKDGEKGSSGKMSKVPEKLKEAAGKLGQERDGTAKVTGLEADLMVVKEVLRTSNRLPSAQFLQIAIMCIKAEQELQEFAAGLGRPGDKGTSKPLSWTARLAALPPVDQIEAIIAAKRVEASSPATGSPVRGTLTNPSIMGDDK